VIDAQTAELKTQAIPPCNRTEEQLPICDSTGATGGPVAVDVLFFSLTNLLLGYTWFRLDRGEIGYTDDEQWKVFKDEVFLVDGKSALEKVDEDILDFMARLHHKHTDPRKTKIVIAAHDMSGLRIGNPSKFVGVDMVSVKRIDKPMPGWWRQK
jgi:hypothetical protein